MSKIFRLGEGSNTYTDWNASPSFPYNSNNRKKIQDPDGATARKEITSIPSPFARIDLVKNAFKEVCDSRDLDGNTIFHKMVSDALDIGELFFNIDRFKDKLEIITWNPSDCIRELIGSDLEGHKHLGDALQKYLQADAKEYNFESLQNVYILNYKKGRDELNVIGATSPATLFFSNANDLSELSEELSFEKDKPFDSSYNPLYKRDANYVKSLYLYRKCFNGFAAVFPEVNDYFELTFKQLPNELREEIRHMDANDAVDFDSISVSHESNNNIVEVLGQPLYKMNGTVSIDKSDFLIDSPKCADQILVLPIERGNTYRDLIYVTEKWGDQKYAEPYDERELDERTLPSRGDKQPYLTISDFLEPQIIRVPYQLNEDEFFTAHKRMNGEDATFLLPLKPLFFKYFSAEDIIEKNMITVTTISKSSADVTLRIPVKSKKQRKYVEYSRSYYDSGNEPEEYNNKGVVYNMKISGFVMPNVRFLRPDEAIYKVGLLMAGNSRYKLNFYNGDNIIPNITPSVRQDESEPLKNAVYTVANNNFEFIRISANSGANCIIIPKFKKQTINNEFRFAVDLGTSNTHVEVSMNGRESEAYGYKKPLVSKFFIQTFNEEGFTSSRDLLRADNIIEKDILPDYAGKESDFHFPTRTILSCAKNIDWTSNQKCLEMHNIPLTYGKRLELSWNDYQYDIKWGTDDKDKAMLRCYVEDLLFMLRNKVVVEGGDLAKTKLTWFYPISMPGGRKQKLTRIWNEKFDEYFPGATGGIEPMSESYAPVLHYRSENTTISNLVNIDIGGGTTDVAYFVDKELSFVTSFKFAANDIFQDAFAKDTMRNGIVDAYKDKIKAVLESNSSDPKVREVLKIFDSDNNRHPANMASFLFSLRDNQNLRKVNRNKIDYNEQLQDDEQFKIVFVMFYTAIIYHIAQIVKLKQLPLPRHISLSGNGSKVIKIVSTDSAILSSYTKKIFELVTGQAYGKNPLGIIGLDKEGSKESTCKGGILGSEPEGNREKQVILTSKGDAFVDGLVFGAIDDAYKKTVEQSALRFFDFFFMLSSKYNMKDDFGITNNSINTAKYYCNQDLGTFINRGLEIQREDYEDSDPLHETLFFYPLKGFLSNLINNLTE